MDEVQSKANRKRFVRLDSDSFFSRGLFLAYVIIQKTLIIAVFIAIWQILPTEGVLNPAFLPPVTDVAHALVSMIQSGELAIHLQASLLRVFFGFGLALAVGVSLGLVMGWYKLFESFVDPLIQLFRNVSALAIYPVFILFLGLGDESKIAILFMAALWPILLNTIAGVKSVDPLLIKSARSMALSNFAIFRKVVLPYSVPSIASGIRLGASVAIVVLVAAEMIGANSGLGFLVMNAQYNFMIPKMYAAIVTLAVLGLIINYILVWLEKKATRWKENT